MRAAARPSSATPWATSCSTDFQSLTTKPWNFQVSCRYLRNMSGCPEAGTPFRSLKADMKVITPASTQALNGGRQTSKRVLGEMSTGA